MSLDKLTIRYEPWPGDPFSGKIVALFNPSQVAFSNNVSWNVEHTAMSGKSVDARRLSSAVREPATLRLELFFDTYEGESGLLTRVRNAVLAPLTPLGIAPDATRAATSVVRYTDAMAALTRPGRETHSPAICKLTWGKWTLFTGVLSELTREFSLFLEDGTPVRATVNCTFMEYVQIDPTPRNELNSPDVAKRYTVRPGDTLVNIAAAFYGDVAVWRLLADTNGIKNPRRLPPGLVLTLPPLVGEAK